MKNARRVGCVFLYAPVPRWRGNLSFSSLYILTATASLESYNCSCSNMQVYNAEEMALDTVSPLSMLGFRWVLQGH